MIYRLRLGVDSITFPLAKVYHFCIYLSVKVQESVIDHFDMGICELKTVTSHLAIPCYLF